MTASGQASSTAAMSKHYCALLGWSYDRHQHILPRRQSIQAGLVWLWGQAVFLIPYASNTDSIEILHARCQTQHPASCQGDEG